MTARFHVPIKEAEWPSLPAKYALTRRFLGYVQTYDGPGTLGRTDSILRLIRWREVEREFHTRHGQWI